MHVELKLYMVLMSCDALNVSHGKLKLQPDCCVAFTTTLNGTL